MIRVIVSAKARDDFREIIAYLSRHAGSLVPKHYAVEFDACLGLVAEHPGMWNAEAGIRTSYSHPRVVRPHILIYSFAGENVEILRILHGKRKITRRKLRG